MNIADGGSNTAHVNGLGWRPEGPLLGRPARQGVSKNQNRAREGARGKSNKIR